MHCAARGGHCHILRGLRANRGNVNVRDKLGRTPLFYAVLARSRECCDFLLAQGCDSRVMDKDGKTAFDYQDDAYVNDGRSTYRSQDNGSCRPTPRDRFAE